MKKIQYWATALAVSIANIGQAQTITKIDEDTFTVSIPSSQLSAAGALASAFTFGLVGGPKSDAQITAERNNSWNAAMAHALETGCKLVARPFNTTTTDRTLRLKWNEAEEAEKANKGSGSHELSYLYKTSTGRVLGLAHNVEEALMYEEETFYCLREEPSHRVVATAIGTPKELMRK